MQIQEKHKIKLCFFDDYYIDFRQNAFRRWFTPELKSVYEYGYHSSLAYSTMYYVPELKEYRFWYEILPNPLNDHQRYLAVARSDNGIDFTPINLHPEKQEAYRNILFDGNGAVYYDRFETDPARKFKFSGVTNSMSFPTEAKIPIFIEFSSDGIHFTADNSHVAHPYTSDALNSVYYNPYDEKYYLSHRAAFVDRRVALRSTQDFKTWSDPEIIFHPTSLDNDNMLQLQFYSMWADYMDGIFYGTLWRYHTDMTTPYYKGLNTKLDAGKMFGFMDCELVYSYDGKHFLRTGSAIKDRPQAPENGCWQLTFSSITTSADGKEYILSANGGKNVHGTSANNKKTIDLLGSPKGTKQFYKIRKDGFCGIEGISEGSQVITKAVELLSDDITFNINASTGFAKACFMDENGNAYDGFSYDDCIPFHGNDTDVTFHFKEHGMAELAGRRIRIGVRLDCATLHAISMHARPFIRAIQESFSNPLQIQEFIP